MISGHRARNKLGVLQKQEKNCMIISRGLICIPVLYTYITPGLHKRTQSHKQKKFKQPWSMHLHQASFASVFIKENATGSIGADSLFSNS